MYFVVIGVVVILMNLLGIGPPAAWTWNIGGDLGKFCVPFGLALVWWVWADATGYNKRREMEKMERRRQARREQNLEALGLDKAARRAKKAGRR